MASQPTEHIAEELLQRAHEPEQASTIFREKIKLRPLHLRPTSPDPSLNARSKRQYARLQKAKAERKSNKPKPLSAKQKRALCIYDIPKEQRKYAIYEPLHLLWCGYMREILGLKDGKKQVNANNAGPFLVSADYHGAVMEIVRSKCVSRVGLKGIVVKDTKFTFELITAKNELKTVPKEQTIFRFEVPFEEEGRKPLVFEIHGNQFEARAPDRANRKFKMHIDLDL
ncbi:hypothetical protein PRZ48_008028 [Zasmidium cellare]|uniref:Ribonuclease P protein subunit n=1 Tax=Zasmidium cellare TaxID=395010 RepID=A0ABR0EEE8_ZASCE|nr:hypothetical protein PRZ48_008028 [Zasmidium cellare]